MKRGGHGTVTENKSVFHVFDIKGALLKPICFYYVLSKILFLIVENWRKKKKPDD